ncbi:MAG: hypothetical protein A2Z83_03190 [Omnitrophica bacterium GWA2_52_8]|nr:MAG: hypothetical protein A2Z83_03190 [Omnitrophica bacterium GWA2_52_8]
MKQRRKYSRFPVQMQAVMTLRHGKTMKASIQDLSMKGARLRTAEAASPKGKCRISLLLGESRSQPTIEIQARVVHCEGHDCAVEFLEMDICGFEHLRTFLELSSQSGRLIEDELKSPLKLRALKP